MAGLLLRLLGLLLIAGAVGVALSRAPDRPVQTLVARWALPPSDFVDVKGQLVHLRDEGPRDDPTPLLLLHGTGASLHTWDGWATALKTHRRVIRIDLPGFGLTGPFAGQYAADDYRGDTYARFVLDFLDALRVQRATVAGNSLGGEVAWRAATLAPQRFDKLILIDATGYPFMPEDMPLGFRVARLPVIGRLGEYLLPRALVAASVRSVYGDPSRVSSDLIDRYFELTLREGNRRALAPANATAGDGRPCCAHQDPHPAHAGAVGQPRPPGAAGQRATFHRRYPRRQTDPVRRPRPSSARRRPGAYRRGSGRVSGDEPMSTNQHEYGARSSVATRRA